MIVGTWNVRGLNKPFKAMEVVDFLIRNKISVFGLLETRMQVSNFNKFMSNKLPNWEAAHNFDIINNGRIALVWDPCRVVCSILDVSK